MYFLPNVCSGLKWYFFQLEGASVKRKRWKRFHKWDYFHGEVQNPPAIENTKLCKVLNWAKRWNEKQTSIPFFRLTRDCWDFLMRLSMNSWESAKDGSSARPRRYKCNKNKEEESEWRTRIVDVLAFSQEAKGGRGSLPIGGNSPPKKNIPQRRKKCSQVFTICHNDSQVQQPLLYYRGKLRSILSIFSTFTVIWVVKISILKTKLESTLSHITVTCETSANWKKKQNPIKVPRIGETAAKLTNPARKDQSFLAPIIIRVKDSFTISQFWKVI